MLWVITKGEDIVSEQNVFSKGWVRHWSDAVAALDAKYQSTGGAIDFATLLNVARGVDGFVHRFSVVDGEKGIFAGYVYGVRGGKVGVSFPYFDYSAEVPNIDGEVIVCLMGIATASDADDIVRRLTEGIPDMRPPAPPEVYTDSMIV